MDMLASEMDVNDEAAADLKTQERKLYTHITCVVNSLSGTGCWSFNLTKLLNSSTCSGVSVTSYLS